MVEGKRSVEAIRSVFSYPRLRGDDETRTSHSRRHRADVVIAPARLWGEPPAAAIAAKMAGVTDELNRNETGKPVQTEQKAIVSDLDELIASLEKEYQDCKNGMRGYKAIARRG